VSQTRLICAEITEIGLNENSKGFSGNEDVTTASSAFLFAIKP
jgi:hypothetical protein